MLEALKRAVCEANLDLVRRGLVVETWGNASGIDRDRGLMVIKPSGVPYESLRPSRMVVVDLATGAPVRGGLRPSSDTPTHLVLYRAFPSVGGIVHTHSLYATAWAQGCRDLPALGTTHADYWHGPVPCTRRLLASEIHVDYEAHTGEVIVERFRRLDPREVPAVLVANHGPFAWGPGVEAAVENAAVLEFVARLALVTLQLAPGTPSVKRELLDRHFSRKHGPGASYGQKSSP
jgi:L-ribulose-5-phosphate 4-epimerase